MKLKPPLRGSMVAIISLLSIPAWSHAIEFNRIVVFGTSLSDPGNLFALTGRAMSPPYDELSDPADLWVPSMPYSTGGHRFSNGATWIEQLAQSVGLSPDARAAFRGANGQARNYAVAGARGRAVPGFVNLADQVETFLADVHQQARGDALYVIDMGANDVRDALASASPQQAGVIFLDALHSFHSQLIKLYDSGARKFLLVNVANLGKVPSILILNSIYSGTAALAEAAAYQFNLALDQMINAINEGYPDIEIVSLDAFSAVTQVSANPAAYGLVNATSPCVMPELAPFHCKNPDGHLFWDGIHPSRAGHAILARAAAKALGLD